MLRLLNASLHFTLAFLGAAEPPKPPTTEGTRFDCKFADGSAVSLDVLEPNLTVTTKYGKLIVPLGEVTMVELGFRYPEGIEAKIAAAVEALGSADFKTREQAQKQLIAYGELALPVARKAMKSNVVEASRRAEEVVKKLEGTLPKEKLELREYDAITTDTMTIKGTIATERLKAKTLYFGETSVKLADLRDMTRRPKPK